MLITKILNEFPATEIVFIDGRIKNSSVVFCLHGDTASNNFLNYWTSFLIYIYHTPNICDPHMINVSSNDKLDSKNLIIDENIVQSGIENMANHLWNYDYIFFIDKSLLYFKPTDICKFIKQMEINTSIDLLSYGKDKNMPVNCLDMKFCIVRNNVLEQIKYPWFEKTKDIDHKFNQKIEDGKFNVSYDENCMILSNND